MKHNIGQICSILYRKSALRDRVWEGLCGDDGHDADNRPHLWRAKRTLPPSAPPPFAFGAFAFGVPRFDGSGGGAASALLICCIAAAGQYGAPPPMPGDCSSPPGIVVERSETPGACGINGACAGGSACCGARLPLPLARCGRGSARAGGGRAAGSEPCTGGQVSEVFHALASDVHGRPTGIRRSRV